MNNISLSFKINSTIFTYNVQYSIKEIISKAKMSGLEKIQIKVEIRANQLLYQVWKQPNGITIGAARGAIKLFDKR